MTEMKLKSENTCPECQSSDIDWMESFVEWTVEPEKEYNVCKAICKSCNHKFEKWCEVTYSFTKWTPAMKSDEQLTGQERSASTPLALSVKPDEDNTNTFRIEFNAIFEIVQCGPHLDDAIQSTTKIFARIKDTMESTGVKDKYGAYTINVGEITELFINNHRHTKKEIDAILSDNFTARI